MLSSNELSDSDVESTKESYEKDWGEFRIAFILKNTVYNELLDRFQILSISTAEKIFTNVLFWFEYCLLIKITIPYSPWLSSSPFILKTSAFFQAKLGLHFLDASLLSSGLDWWHWWIRGCHRGPWPPNSW